MPPRDPTLPEGTDRIIDSDRSLGGSGLGSGAAAGMSNTSGRRGASGMGSIGGAGASGSLDPTGAGTMGTTGLGGQSGATNRSAGASASGSGSSTDSATTKAAESIVGTVKDQVSTLKNQATDRALGFADDGKRQTTDFLQNVAEIIQEAAGSVESRLGGQYAGFGHRAADQVQSLSRTIDDKSVEELVDDARAFVRRSPTVAIGVAALVGFAVSRVVRSSLDDTSRFQGRSNRLGGDMDDVRPGNFAASEVYGRENDRASGLRTSDTTGGASSGLTGDTIGGTRAPKY